MKKAAAVFLVAALWISPGFSNSAKTLESPNPAAAWQQWENVADAGFDAAALAEARSFADGAHSAAVLAVYDGRAIAAWGAVDRKLELHSMRKSLYSAMWGMAVARKLVDVDATLDKAGVDDQQPLTTDEKRARIVDLLHSRSGVYHPSAYATSDQEEARPARGSHPPDTFWFYNNWDFNVAGGLLEKVARKPMGNLFGEWVATPLGMEDYRAEDVYAFREPHTSQWPALTFRMSARDLARLGQLWLNGGSWNGRSLIPPQWVERASTAASNTGKAGQGYGMMWWIYETGSVDPERYPNASRYRILMGRGLGGHVVAVIPEAKMVIVHRADTDNGRRVSGNDVWTLLDRLIGARRTTAQPCSAATPCTAGGSKPARFTPLHVEAFASQLPAVVAPKPVSLDIAAMTALVGSYEIKPGFIGEVFLEGGQLFASMPGRGEVELFALTPSDFFLRVDPTAKVHFDGEANGHFSRIVVSIGGRDIAGRRLEGK